MPYSVEGIARMTPSVELPVRRKSKELTLTLTPTLTPTLTLAQILTLS